MIEALGFNISSGVEHFMYLYSRINECNKQFYDDSTVKVFTGTRTVQELYLVKSFAVKLQIIAFLCSAT